MVYILYFRVSITCKNKKVVFLYRKQCIQPMTLLIVSKQEIPLCLFAVWMNFAMDALYFGC